MATACEAPASNDPAGFFFDKAHLRRDLIHADAERARDLADTRKSHVRAILRLDSSKRRRVELCGTCERRDGEPSLLSECSKDPANGGYRPWHNLSFDACPVRYPGQMSQSVT